MIQTACEHCGLPTRSAGFCCYGCELAAELAREAGEDRAHVKSALIFSVLLTMAVMMLSLFLYAEDIYELPKDESLGWLRQFYRWASWALCTPVMALCGGPLLLRAYRGAKQGSVSVLAVITVGAFAAYVLSLHGLYVRGSVYFDTACTALVLATLGRYLEASAQARASSALGPVLEQGRHQTQQLTEDGHALGRLWPEQIEPGMRLRCEPDETVPVDMRLLEGPVELDLGVLSGESEPVVRQAGELAPAGAAVLTSSIVGVCLRPARESTLERLSELSRSLRVEPSSLQSLAQTFGRALTPAVIGLATAAGAYWTYRQSLGAGVEVALAVLLVACPCTYAISTPLIHWLTMRKALSEGVLIRSAAVLEALSKVRAVAFDKTGTLTEPELELKRAELLAPEAYSLVAALEAETKHPVGRALLKAAKTTAAPLKHRRIVPGRGVIGEDESGRALELITPRLSSLTEESCDVVLLREGALLARFWVGETARENGPAAIEALRKDGLALKMLTGDTAQKAEPIAKALGIPFQAALSPKDKAKALSTLSQAHGPVAMVGDGSNDAPALAGTCTGIAMPEATGLSRGLAQLSLQKPDLRLVPWTFQLSRRAMRLAKRLLLFSTLYNTALLTLAATGALRPAWAGLSMLISSGLTLSAAVHTTSWPGVDPRADEPPSEQLWPTLPPKEAVG